MPILYEFDGTKKYLEKYGVNDMLLIGNSLFGYDYELSYSIQKSSRSSTQHKSMCFNGSSGAKMLLEYDIRFENNTPYFKDVVANKINLLNIKN